MIKKIVACFEKICSRYKPLIALYSKIYIRVVKNEIDLAHINGTDRVLNIGCGPVPFTALLTAKMTGAHVIAVDCDATAVKLARSCVTSMGLEHLVSVVHANGAEDKFESFDVALIALQASPRSLIISNLIKKGTGNQRIISRVPSYAFRNHYDSLPDGIHIKNQITQNMKTFDSSVLLSA